ncbi:MAG: histidine phosphatase family protein [Candidatus Thorarchaeota archaeon]
MKDELLWETGSWTLQVRQLIKNLPKFSVKSKLILILRHSERLEPKEIGDGIELHLTEIGHKIANIFGQKLPKKRHVRIYHSIVARCKETAVDILKGFESKGGTGNIEGILEPLYVLGIDRELFITELKKRTLIEFLRRWMAGLYPLQKLNTISTYCQNAAKIIWDRYFTLPKGGIDIHVTHEILIMALRFGWFGLPPNNYWVNFLGGFAFTFQNNKIFLLDNNQFKYIEYPYWWENK